MNALQKIAKEPLEYDFVYCGARIRSTTNEQRNWHVLKDTRSLHEKVLEENEKVLSEEKKRRAP